MGQFNNELVSQACSGDSDLVPIRSLGSQRNLSVSVLIYKLGL